MKRKHENTRTRSLCVFVSLCLCISATLLAQDLYTLKIDVPVVSVDVAVSDSKGILVNNLTKSDFEIYEDGSPQEIKFFSPVAAPYNVFLLFDRSGSTRNKWEFMQSAVVRFIENLRPQDRIALGSFDDGYDIHLHWSTDRAKALLALDDIVKPRPVNGTRFYAALERTLRREFKNVVGRRAVIVLTDGQDTSLLFEYDRDLKKAFKAAREQRVPSFFIALHNEAAAYAVLPSTKRYLQAVRDNMQELADSSGGQLLFPKTLNEITPLYDQIGRALGTSYSLGYIPSPSLQNRTYRRLEVKTRIDGLQLTQSRTGYVAK